jgi:aspartyl-tRNA(Asn)/glutamyl-tRNA(Gln) amidotransferase subunit A
MQRFSMDMFSETDAILLPLTAIRTPRLEDSDIESGADIDEVVRQLTRFTRPINFLGLPSLAVPAGFDGEGMPISMQLVGRALSEDLLLRLGHAYQSICNWHQRRPPVLTDVRQAA